MDALALFPLLRLSPLFLDSGALPMMRWVLRLAVLLVLGAILAAGVILWRALEKTPLVANAVTFTPAHIERAKRLLDRNDPRTMRPGVLRTLVVSQADLDLAGNYLASRFLRGSTSIRLQEGGAQVHATFELPVNPAGRYLNVDATLVQTASLPRITAMRVGRVQVPAAVSDWLVRMAVARLQSHADYAAAASVVQRVAVHDGMVRVQFVWNAQALGQLQSALVPAAEQQRFQSYQERLIALETEVSSARPLRLEELLSPLLAHAATRAPDASALVAEHRAAIVTLAFYVNGQGLAAVVPGAERWPAPAYRQVTMAGRSDTPLHFMVSAALAASAGSPLADAVGLYKELADARGGSGFSFNDLAADRAGTRLGALAVAGSEGSTRLQRLVARGLRAADLLPDIRDLPEFLTQAEFERRFGGVDAPAYRRLLADIERRIAALALYR